MCNSIDDLHLFTLNVGYARHNADWNWKNVRSPFARLYYVTEGEALVEINKRVYTLTEGHLYFIPAFTKHTNICRGPFAHYYIHIYEEASKSILDEWEYPIELPVLPTDIYFFKRMCELFPDRALPASNPMTYDNHHTLAQNLQSNIDRPMGQKAESRGIVYILISRFINAAKPKNHVKDDHIGKVISYIHDNLRSSLEISTLADMACMSYDYFSRRFREETGETPKQYIRLRKLEKAALLFSTTDMSVKAVAHTLGYEDASYFNRIFHKQMGISPQRYRDNRTSVNKMLL